MKTPKLNYHGVSDTNTPRKAFDPVPIQFLIIPPALALPRLPLTKPSMLSLK